MKFETNRDKRKARESHRKRMKRLDKAQERANRIYDIRNPPTPKSLPPPKTQPKPQPERVRKPITFRDVLVSICMVVYVLFWACYIWIYWADMLLRWLLLKMGKIIRDAGITNKLLDLMARVVKDF